MSDLSVFRPGSRLRNSMEHTSDRESQSLTSNRHRKTPVRRTSLRRTALLALTLLLPHPLFTATISVKGGCILPDAIQAANSDAPVGGCNAGDPGHDEIRLTEDAILVEPNALSDGETGTPTITSPITIEGGGWSVKSEGSIRHFLVGSDPLGTLVLRNTTVTGGRPPGDFSQGGAIWNDGNLAVIDSELYGNDAGRGGAIMAVGGATWIIRSAIRDNVAACTCYPFGPSGGGILSVAAQLVLIDSVVTNNTAESGNYANASGGGIHSYSSDSSLWIVGSEVSYNTAYSLVGSALGGGLAVNRVDTEIVNTTISENETIVDGPFGGGPEGGDGIYSNNATVSLTNSTIANNDQDEFWASGTTQATIQNSIVDCKEGEIIDGGGNFVLTVGSCFGEDAPVVTGLDVQLSDNGGATRTLALLPGSNALDVDAECILRPDQRGYIRDGLCDAGAFEFGAVAPTSLVLSSSGSCPGEVVVSASGAAPGATVRIFGLMDDPKAAVFDSPNCPGTVLEVGVPDTSTAVTADGAGVVSHVRSIELPFCGALVQAVDETTCAVSDPITLPMLALGSL